jgi:hypothetical protein
MSWQRYNAIDLKEKYLYKFIQKNHLFQFLETKKIWFSRADKFGDKLECVLVNELLQEKPDYRKIIERKEKYLISCWHLANNESLALWDTYVDEKSKRRIAAIRFERRYLVEVMNDSVYSNDGFYYTRTFRHGAIKYKNLLSIRPSTFDDLLVKYPAFRKEKAFEYENEYRFVIGLTRKYEADGFLYRLLEPPEIRFDILINPLLDVTEYKSIKEEIKDKGYGRYLKDSALNRWLHPEAW